MTRGKEKLDDGALAAAFNEVAYLYGTPASRADYALQERIIGLVGSRVTDVPYFRTRDFVNLIGDVLTLDDGATAKTKQSIIRTLRRAASAPDASSEAVWNAVTSLRTAMLEMPRHAPAAERALKAVAAAHPHDWEDAYEFAGKYWNSSQKVHLRHELSLNSLRKLVM